MEEKKLRVGFIGLGLMGVPMAMNLHKAGFLNAVYNRTPSKTKQFEKIGVTTYSSTKLLAANVDVVVSCVTGPKDVREIYLGKSGVAVGSHYAEASWDKAGLIAIDMSTIGAKAAAEIAADLKQMGVAFIDAPVTGGTGGATAGTLSIFVGGEKAIYEKILPILEAMGNNIHYMGKSGLGQATKLVNNLIVGETTIALAEGFLLGESLGLKRKQIQEALENVFAVSPSMKTKMPSMVANKFPVTFSVANLRKDLKLAKDENKASEMGYSLPSLTVAEKMYKKGMDTGVGGEDVAAVIKVIED
jgi:3-hydroxyisobutyrate dehydrogenase-like beta-hydroxyacid dehydrogenase